MHGCDDRSSKVVIEKRASQHLTSAAHHEVPDDAYRLGDGELEAAKAKCDGETVILRPEVRSVRIGDPDIASWIAAIVPVGIAELEAKQAEG